MPAPAIHPRPARPRRPRRGFSLVEMIIVCALLAILAGTVVPRLLVVQRQREEKAIVEVEDLLRMYAFRNTAGTQQIGLYFDPALNELSLWIYDLDPTEPEGPRIWQQDRLSAPVSFPDGMTVAAAVADDRTMSSREPWNIPSHPDGSRPRISLELEGREKGALLALENYATAPIRADDDGVVARAPVDLDAEGSALDPW